MTFLQVMLFAFVVPSLIVALILAVEAFRDAWREMAEKIAAEEDARWLYADLELGRWKDEQAEAEDYRP